MAQRTLKFVLTALATLVGTTVALLALQRAREKRLVRFAPKGSLGYWLVGDMMSDFFICPRRYFASKMAEFGWNFTTHLFLTPMIMIGDMEDRDRLIAMESKGKAVLQFPPHINELFGKGSLLLLAGEEHTWLRKLFLPHFTPQAIARFTGRVDNAVLEWFDSAAHLGDFVHSHRLESLTIDILLQTMFGGNATKEEFQLMQEDFPLVTAGLLALVPFPLGRYNAAGRAIIARERLRCTMDSIVSRFKASEEEDKSGLLESLINAKEDGKGLGHEELLNNLVLLGLGGFESTAAAMGTIIAMLYSPEGEQHLMRLCNEVREQIDEDLDPNELKNMPNVNATINEVLRYVSPFNGGFRTALEDLPLKDGTIIPQGVTFRNYFTSGNFNQEYWGKDAQEFDPERFLHLKDGGAGLSYNFVAFGRGMHGCPGEQLVRLVLRVFTVRIVQKYTFEVKDQREVALPANTISSKFKVIKL